MSAIEKDRACAERTAGKRSGRIPSRHARKGSLGQTLKRTFTEFKEDELTDRAAALTYYGVLSIFPALIALVSIVGLVFDPARITKALTDVVSSVGPASAVETFKGPIENITKSSGTAGIMLIVGIAAALWTASGYVGAFMRAANVIYEVEEGRSIVKLRPLQMLVTLVLVLLLALVLVALVLTGPLAEAVGSAVGIGSAAVTAWDIAKWPVLLAVVVVMIALLYYASPNAKLRGVKSILPGAAVAVVVWLVASAAFAFYVANFGSYDKTYGALGGVVIFLVWAWLTNVAILLGARAQRRARAVAPARSGHARRRAGAAARRALRAEDQAARAYRLTIQTTTLRFPMEIPKDKILELLQQQGKHDQVEPAREELPDQVDPERDSGLLAKFGIDPQDLLAKFGGGIPGL